MNKPALLLATTVFTGVLISPVYAAQVCYQWSTFPSERFKLDVKEHSSLSNKTEEDAGNAKQKAYSVHGKEVGMCGSGTMAAVTGTVIKAKGLPNTTGQTGAHMGLEVHVSRGDGNFGGADFCRSIEVDCTTSEATSTPTTWSCESRNEFDIYHGSSTLTQVNEALCGFFEDGGDPSNGVITNALTAGRASGMKQPDPSVE